MANIEEKVKAFLNDEKKVEALGNDKAFMEKVAGGTATNPDIAKKFSELGLELTPDEAEEVGETATAILTTKPVTSLKDRSLDEISGGGVLDVVACGSFVAGAAGTAGALGCNIAGLVCKHKAATAAVAGDAALSAKYSKAASGLNIASIACGGVGVAGTGTGLTLGTISQLRRRSANPSPMATTLFEGDEGSKGTT